jgi:hypothetical protein
MSEFLPDDLSPAADRRLSARQLGEVPIHSRAVDAEGAGHVARGLAGIDDAALSVDARMSVLARMARRTIDIL